MGQVTVTINGRNYEIACDDDQESQLVRLAAFIDKKVAALVSSVGQVGDTRLLVMASLLLADEVSEAYDEVANTRAGGAKAAGDRVSKALINGIDSLVERIEDIAAQLERP
ncbi:MAG: cell division protein ZapA [Alphaproteobacteria bacterium]